MQLTCLLTKLIVTAISAWLLLIVVVDSLFEKPVQYSTISANMKGKYNQVAAWNTIMK